MNNTRRLKLLNGTYIASLAFLAILLAGTLASPVILPTVRPSSSGEAVLPESGRVQLLENDREWVLQYNLVNPEEEGASYRFEVRYGAKVESFVNYVEAGSQYVYIYHFHRADKELVGPAHFEVYRGGEPEPIEIMTLHLVSQASAVRSGPHNISANNGGA